MINNKVNDINNINHNKNLHNNNNNISSNIINNNNNKSNNNNINSNINNNNSTFGNLLMDDVKDLNLSLKQLEETIKKQLSKHSLNNSFNSNNNDNHISNNNNDNLSINDNNNNSSKQNDHVGINQINLAVMTSRKPQQMSLDGGGIDADVTSPTRSDKVVVQVRIVILKVGDIDTLRDKFAGDAFIQAKWREPMLDGKFKTHCDQVNWNHYWSPKLSIENSFGEPEENVWKTIIFDGAGQATVCEKRRISGTFFEFMELNQFPFDSQMLSISLTTERSDDEVEFVEDCHEKSVLITNSFTDEQEWRLNKGVNTWTKFRDEAFKSDNNKHPSFSVAATVTRRPQFFIWNILVVMFLICSLSFSTFSVSLDAPHTRLQLTFILLLTTVSFKFVVNQNLPMISYLTYLDKYILGSMTILAAICVWHAIVGKLAPNVISCSDVKMVDFWMLGILGAIYIGFHLIFVIIVSCKASEKNNKEEIINDQDFVQDQEDDFSDEPTISTMSEKRKPLHKNDPRGNRRVSEVDQMNELEIEYFSSINNLSKCFVNEIVNLKKEHLNDWDDLDVEKREDLINKLYFGVHFNKKKSDNDEEDGDDDFATVQENLFISDIPSFFKIESGEKVVVDLEQDDSSQQDLTVAGLFIETKPKDLITKTTSNKNRLPSFDKSSNNKSNNLNNNNNNNNYNNICSKANKSNSKNEVEEMFERFGLKKSSLDENGHGEVLAKKKQENSTISFKPGVELGRSPPSSDKMQNNKLSGKLKFETGISAVSKVNLGFCASDSDFGKTKNYDIDDNVDIDGTNLHIKNKKCEDGTANKIFLSDEFGETSTDDKAFGNVEYDTNLTDFNENNNDVITKQPIKQQDTPLVKTGFDFLDNW
ncbi:hypothetical protein HELRODRAFT_167179 [Helobdella robusta]|uniref:DUF4706 domain-containing protein n=1 Tax=Helobdella robusta TaxID=6412 RepID=T1EZ38_HELRO|nr:hypothetical protein HELRODRAFT_167179 [Helobdella robusta]ESO10686.1 hypothetical protein HELRODRAFT_167179 [Helobdella robusta]